MMNEIITRLELSEFIILHSDFYVAGDYQS